MASFSLEGARVALLEARMESELSALVRRHGGEPVCVPAMREVERECSAEAAHATDALRAEGAVVVLATGVGLQRWLNVVDGMGRGPELREGLARALIVCRGPKPVAVLKREGLQALVRAEPPHTTKELLDALAALEVARRNAVFVHDGGGARNVPEFLTQRGAHVTEVQPYAWSLPLDVAALERLVNALVQGELRALAVTTQVQARNLFSVAETMGQRDALRDALRTRVVVAAVGPTCARTLDELGAPPHVIPEPSKMGQLVLALAEYLVARP
jgi:uroporphyrinogen-III synthase